MADETLTTGGTETQDPKPQPKTPVAARSTPPAATAAASAAGAKQEESPVTFRERGGFFYPVASRFTGLVQARTDVGERISAPPSGDWLLGEVKAIKNEAFAKRLVYGGNHAHVADGTPLGQPEALKPKPAADTKGKE